MMLVRAVIIALLAMPAHADGLVDDWRSDPRPQQPRFYDPPPVDYGRPAQPSPPLQVERPEPVPVPVPTIITGPRRPGERWPEDERER